MKNLYASEPSNDGFDSSPYDSCEHVGPGPFVNLHNAQGKVMICRRMIGGKDCMPLDEWTSKLT